MKRMVCMLQLLILLSTAALGEGVPGSFQEGQVHYQLSEGVPAVESVTPFIAQPYRFSDSEAIARLFFEDDGYALNSENNDNKVYTSEGETLTVTQPYRDGAIRFDSEYAETVFTPISLVTDIYAMRGEVENWEQELSFMARADAEAQVEQLAGEVFPGASFQSIATFAVTRNDYEMRYEARREELEMWFADSKMSEGMHRRVDFPQEDLGYLICLAQKLNKLPIAWSFFQNVPSAPLNLPVEIWVFLTPEGCKYFSSHLPVMRLQQNNAACQVISREEAIQAFSEAYNYVLGAKEIEVWDLDLVWFTDMPQYDEDGNITGDGLEFRPMWYVYVPELYGGGKEWWGEFGYCVDAVTGETWI